MVFRRVWVWFAVLLPVLLVGFAASASAQVQKVFRNDDVSVDGLYQFTSTASGNGITDTATKSMGGEGSFRHSFNPLLGFEGAYTYARFSEKYTGQTFGYQHNLHDFSGSYYAHGPSALGMQPFVLAGFSALVFAPSLNGGQNVSWQWRPGVNFGAGVNVPVLTKYFGLRLEYRGVYYKAPDFGLAKLTTNSYRLTSEPMAGFYVKF